MVDDFAVAKPSNVTKHSSSIIANMDKNVNRWNNITFTSTDFPLPSVTNVPVLQALAVSDGWLPALDIGSEDSDSKNEFATEGRLLASPTFKDWTLEMLTSAGGLCKTVDVLVTFAAARSQNRDELLTCVQMSA